MNEKLIIFNIQKFSLHDGTGIRTVVFLKGCPLRCRWCCNPESQRETPQLMYKKSRCIGKRQCGLCAGQSCIFFDSDGKAGVDFAKEPSDLRWVDVCPSRALTVMGREIPIDTVLDIVERDSAFYRGGDGGLTVSGGEPLNQENTVLLLKEAKDRRLNTSIETCGMVPAARLLEAARYLDQIFFDIKSLNSEKHRAYTGMGNEQILKNFTALCRTFPDKPVTARTPVIPGFNDSDAELAEIEDFVRKFSGVKWEKLPYHELGVGKYEMLGRKYSL